MKSGVFTFIVNDGQDVYLTRRNCSTVKYQRDTNNSNGHIDNPNGKYLKVRSKPFPYYSHKVGNYPINEYNDEDNNFEEWFSGIISSGKELVMIV
jgi:hypothetical protein